MFVVKVSVTLSGIISVIVTFSVGIIVGMVSDLLLLWLLLLF